MGRKPRIQFEGAVYHAVQRGNNKEYIFKRDDNGILNLDEAIERNRPNH